MNISLQDNLPSNARFPFELGDRVTHTAYGDGTIRGCVSVAGTLQWTVEFDNPPGEPAPPRIPMFYAVLEETLTLLA